MEWEEFLFDVDRKLAEADSRRNSGVSVGDRFSLSSTLIDLDTEQSLSTQELCDGSSKVLIVLLRHFAWGPWRDHVADIQLRKVTLACRVSGYIYILACRAVEMQ